MSSNQIRMISEESCVTEYCSCWIFSGEPRSTKAPLASRDADGVSSQRGRWIVCRCLVSVFCVLLHGKFWNHSDLDAYVIFKRLIIPFYLCSHLYVLQGGLAQQEWRVPELLHRLLSYLEPKLTQVYKNVRERIGRYVCSQGQNGPCSLKIHWQFSLVMFSVLPCHVFSCSVLTYIFMIDVSLPHTQPTKSPHIAEFTERILSQLKPLIEGDEEIQNHVADENGVGEQDERTQAIKLLKTVLKWLMASAGRSFSTPVTQQLQLLPLLFKVLLSLSLS